MVVTLCPCCRETKSGFLPIMRFQLTEVCRAQMGRPSVGVSRHKPPTLCPCGISRLSKSGDGRYSFQRGDTWGHHLPRKRRRQASEKLRASSAISRSAVPRPPRCAASLAKGRLIDRQALVRNVRCDYRDAVGRGGGNELSYFLPTPLQQLRRPNRKCAIQSRFRSLPTAIAHDRPRDSSHRGA